MASTFLRGRQPPMERARAIPPLRQRPVRAVGGRAAGPPATRISLRVQRCWTGASALMTALALGVSIPNILLVDVHLPIPLVAQSVFFFFFESGIW
jgi:hypothetical protein